MNERECWIHEIAQRLRIIADTIDQQHQPSFFQDLIVSLMYYLPFLHHTRISYSLSVEMTTKSNFYLKQKSLNLTMASSPPSSVKSEPYGPLYTGRESNISSTSLLDTSLDHSLPPVSSSIYIDKPTGPSNETPYDNLQGFSAPTLPVYINMGADDHAGDVRFLGTNPLTPRPPLSRSIGTIDVDYALPATTPRHSHQNHYSHHSQNRNRYPYLQRQISTRVLNGTEVPRTSRDGLPHYEQRPALRRSYFALRKPRIPKAPPMPRHLYPGYRPDRTVTVAVDSGGEYPVVEEEEEGPPRKSLLVIIRLVFFFFAIEFMYAVETALTIPILSALRVPESAYSMAWIISPILGFFLQPIIGMWSDTCKCRWGRRRPFILAFAIGAYIGVALLLNSSDLGVLLGDPVDHGTPTRAIILTAIGVTFLDFCADSADAPIRAYLIDTTNTHDQEKGFNVHAILGGFGGGLGYTVGAIQWRFIPIFYKDGGEFTVVFFVGTVLFFVCTLATLTSVREEPLISSSSTSSLSSSSNRENGDTDIYNNDDDDNPEIDNDESRPLLPLNRNNSKSYTTSNRPPRSTASNYFSQLNRHEGFVEMDPATGKHIPHDHVEKTNENILLRTLEQSHALAAVSNADPSNPTPVPAQAFAAELKQKAKLVKLGLMRRPAYEISDDDEDKDNVTVKSMLISMVRMPPRLWKLMICQVIGWIGYFATHLYFTDFVATQIYNGTLETEDEDAYNRYKHGVSMGCWGLFVYSASSALYAFCLERWLSERFSLKTLYFLGYLVYAVGCMVNFFFHHIAVAIAMCFTFGMLVVSLNTLPYHMLSQFHADPVYRNRDGTKRGIGVDCSLLNACYFLGELLVAVSLSEFLDKVGVNYCMVVGAVFTLIGNVSMFFLFYFKT